MRFFVQKIGCAEKRWLLLSFLCAFFSLSLLAEVQSECSFRAGERLSYKAFYNWGVIWVYAADVDFVVSQKYFANRSVYCFESTANSIPRYDWFFKVRDSFKSYVTPDNLSPLFAERNTAEGRLKVYETYAFQHHLNKIYTTVQNSKKPLTRDTIALNPNAYDVLSAVYNARNIDFSRCKINDKIPVKIVLDNQVFPLFIRFLGKETIQDRLQRSFRCYKFSSLLVAGTAFKGGEDVTVWVTDDQNRVPILVEAKVLVGSVKAYLESYDGLKYPMNALLKK